jgi:RimJ/RimL family protein N-acetyltransferase
MIAPTLVSPRLILRHLNLSDFEPYAAMWADNRVTSFIGGAPRRRDVSWLKFCQSVAMWELLGFGYWLFVEKAGGSMIGLGGLASMERGIPQLEGYPEVGWALTAGSWGQGYASEAVAAILDWSDNALAACETRCIIDPENTPSIRVAEKNGFARIDEVENELGRSLVFARRRP